jgi:hypothetical protein
VSCESWSIWSARLRGIDRPRAVQQAASEMATKSFLTEIPKKIPRLSLSDSPPEPFSRRALHLSLSFVPSRIRSGCRIARSRRVVFPCDQCQHPPRSVSRPSSFCPPDAVPTGARTRSLRSSRRSSFRMLLSGFVEEFPRVMIGSTSSGAAVLRTRGWSKAPRPRAGSDSP